MKRKPIPLHYGDLVTWDWHQTPGKATKVCMVCWGGLVSLTNPAHTWLFSKERLAELQRTKQLIRLPVGTQVLLEQRRARRV